MIYKPPSVYILSSEWFCQAPFDAFFSFLLFSIPMYGGLGIVTLKIMFISLLSNVLFRLTHRHDVALLVQVYRR